MANNLKEHNWLSEHPEETLRYAGEYIAVVGEEIVAHGKTVGEVLKVARAKTGKNPLIDKVLSPDKEWIV